MGWNSIKQGDAQKHLKKKNTHLLPATARLRWYSCFSSFLRSCSGHQLERRHCLLADSGLGWLPPVAVSLPCALREMSLTRMSGGGGGIGGPTVSHEPGVRNDPLLIAAVWIDTGHGAYWSISSSKTPGWQCGIAISRGPSVARCYRLIHAATTRGKQQVTIVTSRHSAAAAASVHQQRLTTQRLWSLNSWIPLKQTHILTMITIQQRQVNHFLFQLNSLILCFCFYATEWIDLNAFIFRDKCLHGTDQCSERPAGVRNA